MPSQYATIYYNFLGSFACRVGKMITERCLERAEFLLTQNFWNFELKSSQSIKNLEYRILISLAPHLQFDENWNHGLVIKTVGLVCPTMYVNWEVTKIFQIGRTQQSIHRTKNRCLRKKLQQMETQKNG